MSDKRRQSNLIAGALFISLFLLWGSCYNTFGVFFTPLLKEFKETHASVSLLATAIVLTTGLTAPLAGWLIKLIDVRVVMGLGATLAGISLLAISRAETFGQVLIGYLLLGVGLGGSTMVPATLVITNWFTERRATVLGLATVGMELGGMLMTLLASHLISIHGWRATYFVLAVPIFLIVLPVVVLVVRTSPEAVFPKENQVTPPILAGLEVREALHNRSFRLLGIVQMCFGLGVGGAFVHVVPMMLKVGYREETAAVALSTILGLIVLGKPAMGFLGDYFGARQALAAALAVCAISILCMGDAYQSPILGLGILFFGLTLATPVPLVPVILADIIGPKSMGPLFGLLLFAQLVGAAISPVIVGEIFDVTGTYTIGYALTAAIILGAAISVLGCVKTPNVISPGLVIASR
jgi:MFS family permease